MEKFQAGKAVGSKRIIQQDAWPIARGLTGVLPILTNESFGVHKGYFSVQKEWGIAQWKLDQKSDFIRFRSIVNITELAWKGVQLSANPTIERVSKSWESLSLQLSHLIIPTISMQYSFLLLLWFLL